MAVPRNRHSNARKNSKRAHQAKKPYHLAKCPNCGGVKLPHRICAHCGQYHGRQMVAVAKTEEA
ncbi:MAG: ribosomal protein [Chlamydiales bacterium]|jgi:large subunit ribosomal protein L32|nr:ribosomal protein [Chlamydiales bacterium]